MIEEVRIAVSKFELALETLKSGHLKAATDLERDGVIQRFEYTFELFWKLLKIFLEKQGIAAKSPRETFQGAFKLSLYLNESPLLILLEDRNKTAHVYNRKIAQDIYSRMGTHITTFDTTLLNLKSRSQ